MGVIPCDRDGCDGIMCDFFVYGAKFYPNDLYRICGECLEELLMRWRNRPTATNCASARAFVDEFMDSRKIGGCSRYVSEADVERFKVAIGLGRR